MTFVGKIMSLLFNMLSRLLITFLPRSNPLLISWLQSPSAVILGRPKIKSVSFQCSPIYLPWSDGTRCQILVFWMLSFKPTFSLSSLNFINRLFSSVKSLSRVRLFATLWIAACQASLFITNSWSSLRLNVHPVRDAIQPSHPLSSPSPSAPNPSQHQSFFQWVNSSHEVAKVLEFQL